MHSTAVILAASHLHTAAKVCSSFSCGWNEKPISGPLPGLIMLLVLVLIAFAVIRGASRRRTSANR